MIATNIVLLLILLAMAADRAAIRRELNEAMAVAAESHAKPPLSAK